MLAALPVLFPFLTAIGLLLLRNDSPRRRTLSIIAFGAQVALALALLISVFQVGTAVMFVGSWEAPIGIIFVADKAAAMLVMISAVVALAGALVGLSEQARTDESPLRQPLLHFLLCGIQLSFLTGDIFNLFVAFEVMLLSSYALLTLEGRAKQLKHAYPYVILNILGSAFFLAACGYAYSVFGTLNMARMAEVAATLNDTPEGAFKITILTALFAFVFSIKAGMFPLYFWLPNSYPILPASIAAVFGGLLTKVGIYVLLRLLGTIMPHNQDSLYLLIAWLGGGTMLFGVLGAVSRMRVREILAFHVLSQVGFMILAIGFFTPLSFAATLFYMMHHILVKAGLFLSASAIIGLQGTDYLKRTGGMVRSNPMLAASFLLLAFSLAGLPPLSGFWAKLWILLEGFSLGFYALVAISLIASVLTLASMLKIWIGAFWQPAPADAPPPARWAASGWCGLGILLIGSIAVVFAIAPLWDMAQSAAADLMNPQVYIQAVFPTSNP